MKFVDARLSLGRSPRMISFCIALVLIGCLVPQIISAGIKQPPESVHPPMLFEQNKGQFDKSVDYISRSRGYTVALSHSPVIELFRFQAVTSRSNYPTDEPMPARVELQESAHFRLRLQGVNESALATPMEQQVTRTHYISGRPQASVTDVPNFKRIRFEKILKDIDVDYYGADGRLEFDFIVHPGGDPTSIQMVFEGAEDVSIDDQGNLVIELGGREIIQRAPVSYQLSEDGHRTFVHSSYSLEDGAVGFELTAWDRKRPLIIDPIIEYSSYYGGAGGDYAQGVDIDAAGNIYIIATTTSAGLATPVTFQDEITPQRNELFSYPSCPDCTDIGEGDIQVERVDIRSTSALLVTKFSPDGKTVLWSTYFNVPGSFWSVGINSAAISDSGEVAFGLYEVDDGLPLVNETQVYDENQKAGYVAKLNSSGNGLVFGTYLQLGDYFRYWIRGLDVSPDGKVAVTGQLSGINGFPTVIGIPGQSCTLNAALSESSEGYVALFNSAGTLIFSSCLGGEVRDGSSAEGLRAVNIGSNGHLYVAGYSSMTDFPVVNPIQATKNLPGAREMTISQINPATGELVFSTWFGPTEIGFPPIGEEYTGNPIIFWPLDIIIDSDENIIVTGDVGSLSYPTVNALQNNMGAPNKSTDFLSNPAFGSQSIAYLTDYFLTKLHPTNGIVFSTYIGGAADEGGIPALALDSDDNIYLSGATQSDDFPMLNAIQPTKPSDFSPVISKITPKGGLAFSTFLGGSSNYPGNLSPKVAVNSTGQIILAGNPTSTDFPIVGSTSSLSGTSDITLTIIDQSGDTDTDGDGVPDAVDAFPEDDTEWRNIDGDLLGDNTDPDDDGDEVADASDRFPQDPTESVDSDEDGAGDNLDEFDADPYNYFDFDDDNLADFNLAETDDDNDGVEDVDDPFDFDPTESIDSDRDGLGDNGDPDDDNDGLPDSLDPDHLDAEVPVMTFESYSAHDASKYKSPWPEGFASVEGADLAWTSAQDKSHTGLRSFGSRIIGQDQTTAIKYVATFEVGFIEFWYKVESEQDGDFFTFKVDGQTLISDSGDSGWVFHSMPITPGEHTLEWSYSKNGTISSGSDAAWIDDMKIIGDTIFESGFE